MRMLLACPTPGPAPGPSDAADRLVADAVPDALARVARRLRDAGHEVILAGGLSPAAVVPVAVQEDVEVVVWLGAPPDVDVEAAGDDAVVVLADPSGEALVERAVAHADGVRRGDA